MVDRGPDRRLRRRHGSLSTDLVRASAPDNGARHPARPAVLRFAALALVSAAAAAGAGCSLSIPLSGVKTDATPTGSVDRTVALLSPPSPASPPLDREDLRRARAAMAVALDPQGNGARAGWQNPQTGAHGGFAAAAPPYTDHDRVCRRFVGEIVSGGGSGGERRLSGAACRDGDGTWQVLPEQASRAKAPDA